MLQPHCHMRRAAWSLAESADILCIQRALARTSLGETPYVLRKARLKSAGWRKPQRRAVSPIVR